MKFFIAVILSILTIGLFGQTADSLGLDDNPILNSHEAHYFNNEFKNLRNDFDFTEKKVAFIAGSAASKHQTKSAHFNEVTARLKGGYRMTHSPTFLTNEERIRSGGYDVIITCWVKLLTDKRRRQIISELSY